jgi:hypothetical protein
VRHNSSGKNDDYNWLSHHVAYVSMWDAWMNEIFTKMHLVITYEKYLIWYIIITYHVITLGLKEVSPPGYMQYKQHVQCIQNIVSNLISFIINIC